jgi:hypothetical protein
MTKKSNTEVNRNYKVGYGLPPKHSQFKKGQSGNPRGRKPKAIEYLKWKDPIFDVLLEDMTLSINGKPTQMPAIVWMLKSMLHKAITKGCPRSFKALVDAAGHGGLQGLWYELKSRKHEKDQETIMREIEEAQRFLTEELPKFARRRDDSDKDEGR